MNKNPSRLTKAILETANDMADSGLLSRNDHKKITMRNLNKEKMPVINSMKSQEIKL